MTFKTKNLTIVAIVLVAVVFLIGFVPQYQRATALGGELTQTRERVASLEHDLRLSRARDLASMTYLEVTKNNFGTAAGIAPRFFDSVREVGNATQDPQLRSELQAIMRERDAVVAGLATADPAIQPVVRQILERLFQASGAL